MIGYHILTDAGQCIWRRCIGSWAAAAKHGPEWRNSSQARSCCRFCFSCCPRQDTLPHKLHSSTLKLCAIISNAEWDLLKDRSCILGWSSPTTCSYILPHGLVNVYKSMLLLLAVKPELPPGWNIAKDTAGRAYYWHAKTKKTTWEKPTASTPIE